MARREVVLGFDARALWPEAEREWPAWRRAAYLIRRDVARPLSVDEASWPSVFDADPGLARPPWTGCVQSLWADLAALDGHVAAWGGRARAHAIVAVTLVAGAGGAGALAQWWHDRLFRATADGTWQALAAPTPADSAALLGVTPAALDATWERLGYDVADGWLTSGLSNCGAGGGEPATATGRAAFGRSLNHHHLFAAVAPAARFARLADQQVPEHAPFFVYGLWQRHAAVGP